MKESCLTWIERKKTTELLLQLIHTFWYPRRKWVGVWWHIKMIISFALFLYICMDAIFNLPHGRPESPHSSTMGSTRDCQRPKIDKKWLRTPFRNYFSSQAMFMTLPQKESSFFLLFSKQYSRPPFSLFLAWIPTNVFDSCMQLHVYAYLPATNFFLLQLAKKHRFLWICQVTVAL